MLKHPQIANKKCMMLMSEQLKIVNKIAASF